MTVKPEIFLVSPHRDSSNEFCGIKCASGFPTIITGTFYSEIFFSCGEEV